MSNFGQNGPFFSVFLQHFLNRLLHILVNSSQYCAIQVIVLQISRLSEGSTGQIFATSSVIYQMKMRGL